MKILIVGLVNNFHLLRVREEGEKRGHTVDGCYASDLVIKASEDKFETFLKSGSRLSTYDLIYLWAVGKRRWDWYVACDFLSRNYKTIIVNNKVVNPNYNYYLSSASDYLKQTENSLPYPKSAIVCSPKAVDFVVSDFQFPLIVKIPDGRQGRGVFKIEDKTQLEEKVKELLEENSSVIIREFIPNDGDVRIFTVGYRAIGAMKRTPTKEGEFRSNISQGGRGEKFDLDSYPELRDIAEKLSKVTMTEIAGVDIMLNKYTNKPYILEINPGPQFEGLEKYTGVNAAKEIIMYFEQLYDGSRRLSKL
jgi:RimK family alpha-L-glutamate ligase